MNDSRRAGDSWTPSQVFLQKAHAFLRKTSLGVQQRSYALAIGEDILSKITLAPATDLPFKHAAVNNPFAFDDTPIILVFAPRMTLNELINQSTALYICAVE